jgi:hypothetical protein
MTRLTEQYLEVAMLLRESLNDSCLAALDSPDDGESDRAMAVWLNAIDEKGYLEIGAQYSNTGNTITFSDLTT